MVLIKKISILSFLILIFTNSVRICYGQSPTKKDYAADLAVSLEPTRKIVYKKTDKKELRLHVFEPAHFEADDRRPCFIAFHGGGWTKGEPRRFYPVVSEFVKKGMVGISVEYRLLGTDSGNTVFDCVKDGRSAIRYIRVHAKELGIDPNQIIVSGGSAGAHIAAATALFEKINEETDPQGISTMPDVMVLYYPVLDTSPEGFGSKKIGAQWQDLSPLHHVRKGLPPTIVFHGTRDSITPINGTKAFQAAMIRSGNRCELIIKDGGTHGYMMFEKDLYEEAMYKTMEFLKESGIVVKK